MARHLDEEKRQAILGAAFDAFGEHGYRKTTIKDIAVIAGIAPGSVYTYFDDKEDLFRNTVHLGLHTFYGELKRIISLPIPYEVKFDRVIDFGFDLFKRVHPIFRGMFTEANQMNLLQENIDNLCEAFEELFEEGHRLGVIEMFDQSELSKLGIKIFISGVLFHTSMIPRDRLDEEIEKLKGQVKQGLEETFKLGVLK
jgi:AcrR family transcriptional regulator